MTFLEFGKIDKKTEQRLKEMIENKSFKAF